MSAKLVLSITSKAFYCKVKCYLFPPLCQYQLILGLARLGLRRNHNMPKTKINAGMVVMSRSMSTFLSLVQCTGCSIDIVVFTETANLQYTIKEKLLTKKNGNKNKHHCIRLQNHTRYKVASVNRSRVTSCLFMFSQSVIFFFLFISLHLFHLMQFSFF